MRYIKSFQNDAAIQAAIDDKSLGKPYVALNNQTGTIDWDSKAPTEPKDMYLTIEALSGGTFYVRKADIGYSVNGGAWETTTGVTTLALNQGDEVRFKGTAGGNSLFTGNTLAFNAYGNIESLEYGDNFVGQTSVKAGSAFTNCFKSCSGLTDASNLVLPATTLTVNCYAYMFDRCKSLTTAPQLPATTLAQACYRYMFPDCRSLTTAPELPATTLAASCYNGMFQDSTNLNYIKCLATDISATNCTYNWVYGVAATGTFVKDPSMASWTTGIDGIPSGWTVIEE